MISEYYIAHDELEKGCLFKIKLKFMLICWICGRSSCFLIVEYVWGPLKEIV